MDSGEPWLCLSHTSLRVYTRLWTFPFKIVKGVICLCCMWTTRLRVGLSVSLIYSLMGRCHRRLSPCHYSWGGATITPITAVGGEDVWTVKMSKEKTGGQGADLQLIPSILGAPLGRRRYICPSCIFLFQKAAVHPLWLKIPVEIFGMDTHMHIHTA